MCDAVWCSRVQYNTQVHQGGGGGGAYQRTGEGKGRVRKNSSSQGFFMTFSLLPSFFFSRYLLTVRAYPVHLSIRGFSFLFFLLGVPFAGGALFKREL